MMILPRWKTNDILHFSLTDIQKSTVNRKTGTVPEPNYRYWRQIDRSLTALMSDMSCAEWSIFVKGLSLEGFGGLYAIVERQTAHLRDLLKINHQLRCEIREMEGGRNLTDEPFVPKHPAFRIAMEEDGPDTYDQK
jgi:hypothetical protein